MKFICIMFNIIVQIISNDNNFQRKSKNKGFAELIIHDYSHELFISQYSVFSF